MTIIMKAKLNQYICFSIAQAILFAVFVIAGQAQSNKQLDYQIWKVFSQDTKGFTIVVVSVNPKHFNREDMTALAAKLKAEFTQNEKLKVGLLDDENVARLFVSGRLEYADYERSERGRYYLDRSKCKEYIRFVSETNKSSRIKLECSR